ncbi:MAG: glycosyltransferase [Cyanobacteria bacterium P01_A01_bin.135]
MRILFLDQSSKLGGAELCLADIAHPYRDSSLVAVFNEGPFPQYLRERDIPVTTLMDQTLEVKKASGFGEGLKSLNRLLPLIYRVSQLSQGYDLIYANTQKALVVGAIASALAHRPFVYHLHDIVSPDHFSATNRRVIVTLANRACRIIANSHASKAAFIAAGGRADRVQVVYNGFDPRIYAAQPQTRVDLRESLAISDGQFVIGHFSRLSPWKGQHVLIDALSRVPEHAVALLVGEALFGEVAYTAEIKAQIHRLGLEHRVKFLGFRSDIPQLMSACDLVAHTSTAPEPFGRVIVEGMLCHCPVVAADAGGAAELIESGYSGWLIPPGDAAALAEVILHSCGKREEAGRIAHRGYLSACDRFSLRHTNRQIHQILTEAIAPVSS